MSAWFETALSAADLLGLFGHFLVLTAAYAEFSRVAAVSGALRGMGAVAAGLIIATAIRLMTTLGSNRLGPPLATAFAVLTFVTIVWLRWPLIWVVAGLGTTAVAIAYARTP